MKHIVMLIAWVMVTLATYAQPNKALEYRFEVMPGGTGTPVPFYVSPTILAGASNFTNGSGLAGPVGYTQGASLVNPDKAYWGNNWTTLAFPAIDINDWFGFTMTPPAGNMVIVDSITFWERRSSTGPQWWQLRIGPSFTSAIAWGQTMLAAPFPPQPFAKRTIIPASLNFSSTIDLHIYGSQSTNNAGTWRIDTVRVYAHLDVPVPIELISFSGEQVGDEINLAWTTATETDNDHFTIYRSENGQGDWQKVGTISGAGTSEHRNDYTLVDEHPKSGINYYKLRQTDTDGATNGEDVIAVEFKPSEEVIVYPNPSAKNAPVYLSREAESVIVMDAAGRFITTEVHGTEVQFDAPAGTYTFLVVDLHGDMERIEVVRQ